MPPFDVIEPTSDAIASIAPEAAVPDEVLEPLVVVPVKEATPDELMVRHTPSAPEGLLTTSEGDVWFTTVQRLLAEERVTALVRELALQAQLVAIDESVTPAHWLLRIERESLNQGATRERLATALNEAGIVVTLAVELGLVQDTPAKRIAFATEQKLADARAVMENDPFVQHMMRDFGATIVPGTLKPQEAT
jgi:DNA polymerase-3 subunit gamma/tau